MSFAVLILILKGQGHSEHIHLFHTETVVFQQIKTGIDNISHRSLAGKLPSDNA